MRQRSSLALVAAALALASWEGCSPTAAPPPGKEGVDGGGPAGPDGGGRQGAPGAACASNGDCQGPGGLCLQAFPGGYCVKPCAKASDCPEGSTCLDLGAGPLCVEGGCAGEDANCSRRAEGYYCDPTDDYCTSSRYVPANPGGRPMGDGCTDPSECEGGVCLAQTAADGTPTGDSGGYCTADCLDGRPDSCPDGATCLDGLCRKSCAEAGDCRGAPYACVDGTCRLDPAGLPFGRACARHDDCGGTAACLTAAESAGTFPGGACVLSDDCDPATGSGCAAAGACVALVDSDAQGNEFELPTCVAACRQDSDCRVADGYRCDPARHACLRPPANDPAEIALGAACTTDQDCDLPGGTGGLCLTGPGFPQGYCIAPGCTEGGGAGTPDSCAAAGGSCWVLGLMPQRACIEACSAASQCRTADGYTCDDAQTCWYAPP